MRSKWVIILQRHESTESDSLFGLEAPTNTQQPAQNGIIPES
jgi:hypothetical protein